MKRIGVFTSGGDSPGMNAAIRAVVRTATYHGIEVYGIMRGYSGMIKGEFVRLDSASVSNTVQKGGTILKSARSQTFMTKEGRQRAFDQLVNQGIEGLVAIGGNGTFTGAMIFEEEFGIPTVGAPGTIDNDLYGTDYTIGYDTAVMTALDAIDKLRDTGASHERIFVVEVMGRRAGHIALEVAVAGGAEEVLIPEDPIPLEQVVASVKSGLERGKSSSIVVVAEGVEGGAEAVRAAIVAATGLEARTTILGHIQRGGSPSARDRVLASRLGEAAVNALIDRVSGVMCGLVNNNVTFTALPDTWEKRKDVNRDLYSCAKTLSI